MIFVLMELKRLGFNYISTENGEIYLGDDVPFSQIIKLDTTLHEFGLDVVLRQSTLTDKVRYAVLFLIKNNITLKIPFSRYLSRLFSMNYIFLNALFARETGISIGEYYDEKWNMSGNPYFIPFSDMPDLFLLN